MTENNASQAYFPDGAEVLANPIGTAPGFMLDREEREGCSSACPACRAS